MKFENPPLPEGINVSASRPVCDFFSITVAVVATAAVATAVLYWIAGYFAARVPFALEARLANQFIKPQTEVSETRTALQDLINRLVPHLDLPSGMTIRLHYDEGDTVNALATLGGNMFMYAGLLERIPHENALAMVLAHEISHVKHRDATVSAGRGVTLALALSMVSSGAGDAVASTVIGSTSSLTGLSFNREQELQADESALAAVAKLYGHVGGAADLFRLFQKLYGDAPRAEPPRFLATHPLTQARIDRLVAIAAKHGWATEGPVTPLAAALRVKAKKEDKKSP